MDLQTLANLGEFLGGVGVFISLLYLALQIRGSNASQRSETYARSLERLSAMQQRMAEDRDFTKLYNEGLFDPAQLTITQRTQFTWVLTELFGTLEFMYLQAQEGSISRELWQRWRETLKWWLTFPGIKAWWAGKPTPFTPSFARLVEQCMQEGYQPEREGAWEAYIGPTEARG